MALSHCWGSLSRAASSRPLPCLRLSPLMVLHRMQIMAFLDPLTEALVCHSSSNKVSKGRRVGTLAHSRCPLVQVPSSRSDRPKGNCLSAWAFNRTSKGSPLGLTRLTGQHSTAKAVTHHPHQRQQAHQQQSQIYKEVHCQLLSRRSSHP